MSTPRLNCIDTSRWSGELTLAEARAMKAQGIDWCMVATGPGNYSLWTRQQASAAVAAGMRLAAYTFLEFESDPEWWVRDSVADVDGLPVELFSLDVEDAANGKTWSANVRIDYAMRAAVEFERLGWPPEKVPIYSAAWFWIPYMGNTDVFAKRGHKLHRAFYDGEPDIDDRPDFGGWTEADILIEQYQGTTLIAGHSVDLNYLVEERLPGGEDMGMTSAEKAEFAALQERVNWAEGSLADIAVYLAGNPFGAPFDGAPDGGWDNFFRETLGVLGAHGGPLRGADERIGDLEGATGGGFPDGTRVIIDGTVTKK